MPSRSTLRRSLTVATVVALTALVACGSDGASTSDSTVPSPTTELTSPSTVPSSPAPTSPPAATTASAPTEPAPATAPSTASETELGGYVAAPDRSTPALVDERTDPIVTPLSDGLYWSWDYAAAGGGIEFTLSQYFVGSACREQFGDADEACASDNETLYEPSATLSLPGDGAAAVTVLTSSSVAPFDPYEVSPAELVRLVAGADPAPDAPAGYEFIPFPMLLSVTSGEITGADQIFVS
jgi:hypothetical protein